MIKFKIADKETALLVIAQKDLSEEALNSTLKHRAALDAYIIYDPQFAKTFSPHHVFHGAPAIVKAMAEAAKKTGVGPMSAVAGAMAEAVGHDLLFFTDELIIENGADVFLKISRNYKIAITKKIAIEVAPCAGPFAICTSSGASEPSFGFGKADAVAVVSKSASLADAAATAIGNFIKETSDIEKGIKFAQRIRDLDGVLIVKEDHIGVMGKIKIVPA